MQDLSEMPAEFQKKSLADLIAHVVERRTSITVSGPLARGHQLKYFEEVAPDLEKIRDEQRQANAANAHLVIG